MGEKHKRKVEKEEHKKQQNAYLRPPVSSCIAVAPALVPSRVALLPTSVPSGPVTPRLLLYYILSVTQKEIGSSQKKKSKVERRIEERRETKEKTIEYSLLPPRPAPCFFRHPYRSRPVPPSSPLYSAAKDITRKRRVRRRGE